MNYKINIMKSILLAVNLLFTFHSFAAHYKSKNFAYINGKLRKVEKLNIKIKNDSENDVTVYNDGNSTSYRLMKNTTTSIKMKVGDKLYYYEGGKKSRLLLTASLEMEGKLQLYSKL